MKYQTLKKKHKIFYPQKSIQQSQKATITTIIQIFNHIKFNIPIILLDIKQQLKTCIQNKNKCFLQKILTIHQSKQKEEKFFLKRQRIL